MLTIKTTLGVYAGFGLLVGLNIKRPVYGISYGVTNGLMTIALGILFGPQGYYASIGIQTLVLCSKVGHRPQADNHIHRTNRQNLKTLFLLRF